MKTTLRVVLAAAVAAALFAAGYAAAQQKNQFETPGTIIHVVTIKFKADAPEAERQKVLEGVRQMAAEIPGIKRVWTKPIRVQPRDFQSAFVIEFADAAAADNYAKTDAHRRWNEHYQTVREASNSQQVTN
jgi:ABC-type glycerol-3-phosphate transport system substrate-binding protein